MHIYNSLGSFLTMESWSGIASGFLLLSYMFLFSKFLIFPNFSFRDTFSILSIVLINDTHLGGYSPNL